MEWLKINDYIEFPCNLSEERKREICEIEEVSIDDVNTLVGRVATVINNNSYLVITARPCAGYKIIVENSQIIRKLSVDEVSDEDDLSSFDVDSAGLKIFTCDDEPKGETIREKCRDLVNRAIESLFPEEIIESVCPIWSDFLKTDFLKSVDHCIERHSDKHDYTKLAELKKKRTRFVEMLHHMRFREYYSLIVDLAGNKNYFVAVSTDLREVVIPCDKFELSVFVDSLGPEFVPVYKHKMDLLREVIVK